MISFRAYYNGSRLSHLLSTKSSQDLLQQWKTVLIVLPFRFDENNEIKGAVTLPNFTHNLSRNFFPRNSLAYNPQK